MDLNDRQTQATTEQVDRDVLIPASTGDVWEVITADGWLAETVELELRPGGEAHFADPGSVRTGWVEEARPPGGDGCGALVFWWGPEGEPSTRVALELEPEGEDASWLRVTESRPLEALDLVGLPLRGQSGTAHGPAMLAVA